MERSSDMSSPYYNAVLPNSISVCLYMDNASLILNECQIGFNINNASMDHLFYADCAVLLVPYHRALQKLLDVCLAYVSEYELKGSIYLYLQSGKMSIKDKGPFHHIYRLYRHIQTVPTI